MTDTDKVPSNFVDVKPNVHLLCTWSNRNLKMGLPHLRSTQRTLYEDYLVISTRTCHLAATHNQLSMYLCTMTKRAAAT